MGNTIKALVGADPRMLQVARQHLKTQAAKWPDRLTVWERKDWPAGGANAIPSEVQCVWRSSRFMVQEYRARFPAMVRLSVLRLELDDAGGWRDGITWDELQTIKSQCGYGHCAALEIYPQDADVVNVANMRHLWVLTSSLDAHTYLPFMWRQGFAT